MKKTLAMKDGSAGQKVGALIQTRLDEDRVSAVLDATAAVCIRHGFEGASTNEIARQANCSKTTLYARFPTKEKLFLAVLERRIELILSQFATALQP